MRKVPTATLAVMTAAIISLGCGGGRGSPPTPPTPKTTGTAPLYYDSCRDVWEDRVTPLRRGDPGYRVGLDPDLNGEACE